MAIAVGDVVELGVSDASSNVSKLLGIVESDNGEMLRVFVGCKPLPLRDVPRVSVRRVWVASEVRWGDSDYNSFIAAATSYETGGESLLGGGGDRGNNNGKNLNNFQQTGGSSLMDGRVGTSGLPEAPLLPPSNPLRTTCGVWASVCEWRSPVATAVIVVLMVGLTLLDSSEEALVREGLTSQLFVSRLIQAFLAAVLVATIGLLSFTYTDATTFSPWWLPALCGVMTTHAILSMSYTLVAFILCCAAGGVSRFRQTKSR